MASIEPFADISDYENICCPEEPLTREQRIKISSMLKQASIKLRSLGVSYDSPKNNMSVDEWHYVIKSCTCNSVERAYSKPTDFLGVTDITESAGPYSQNLKLTNPNGDIYFTKDEKRMLGICGSKIGTINPEIGG